MKTLKLLITICLIASIYSSKHGYRNIYKARKNETTKLTSPLSMLLQGETNKPADICPDSLFAQILNDYSNKYPWESHHITTEDNYILRAFRIQTKNTSIVPGKPVVWLQHGTLDSADDWIINEEKNSIGLRLANEGYDVWLGNSRGNKYSLDTAVKMTPKQYWNFSF